MCFFNAPHHSSVLPSGVNSIRGNTLLCFSLCFSSDAKGNRVPPSEDNNFRGTPGIKKHREAVVAFCGFQEEVRSPQAMIAALGTTPGTGQRRQIDDLGFLGAFGGPIRKPLFEILGADLAPSRVPKNFQRAPKGAPFALKTVPKISSRKFSSGMCM